ncbi:Calycin-like protein [Basidiobolus meristosporus CBS 931.73]|uniref:Calycin-like protein n=1 Tax=Basidiobolus meristosporus CBS 931.73 TaxID=1314790 RepID=A0A1Y1WSY4_9FUNG|nr:Calycin-like protein [Basidiobolus meristosporus CBS 931.73]|eukprot:ORX76562.1 Calycin-like protein [Basidiobolus meristosporus CBS 931.73]
MKSFIHTLTPIIAAIGVAGALSVCPSPPPSYNLDVTKYQGKWYEIGTTWTVYNTFEKDCKCVTANYTLQENGSVQVNNTCVNTNSNTPKSIIGTAQQTDPQNNPGYLNVTFPSDEQSWLSRLMDRLDMGPNYVVVNIWGDYEIAFVGSTCQSAFWILARQPELDEAKYREVVEYATGLGYNFKIFGFKKTIQGGDNCLDQSS